MKSRVSIKEEGVCRFYILDVTGLVGGGGQGAPVCRVNEGLPSGREEPGGEVEVE